MKIQNRLSVAIPTYNRPEALLSTISSILPQLLIGVPLLVIDNCSDSPVSELLANDGLPGLDYVRIKRNRANIGGNANISRCLEDAESEWVWLIGDDDPILPDAITRALRFIEQAPEDCLYIGFAHHGIPGGAQVVRDVEAFLEWSARGFGDILFITAGLYRVGKMQRNIHFAYQWAGTCAPHLVLLLSHWEMWGGSALLLEVDLRQSVKRITTGGQSQMISFCLSILPHLPMTWARSPHLAKIIADRFLSPQALIYESLLEYRRGRQSLGGAVGYFNRTARLKYKLMRRAFETVRFGFALLRCISYRLAVRLHIFQRPMAEDELIIEDRR